MRNALQPLLRDLQGHCTCRCFTTIPPPPAPPIQPVGGGARPRPPPPRPASQQEATARAPALPPSAPLLPPPPLQHQALGTDTKKIPPPPAPPRAPVQPTSKPFRPSSRQLAKEGERVARSLPLPHPPATAKPLPGELQVGTHLRVEWAGSWWVAIVKEEQVDKVKVGFSATAHEHDEWLSRDSDRIRLGVDGDVMQPLRAETRLAMNPVGAPYNPLEAFRKRQVRLKEKIAAMQLSRLGVVDPALTGFLAPPSVPRDGPQKVDG